MNDKLTFKDWLEFIAQIIVWLLFTLAVVTPFYIAFLIVHALTQN